MGDVIKHAWFHLVDYAFWASGLFTMMRCSSSQRALDQASIPARISFLHNLRIKGEVSWSQPQASIANEQSPIDLTCFLVRKMTNLSWDEKIIFKASLTVIVASKCAWYRYRIMHSVIVSESKRKGKGERRRKRKGGTRWSLYIEWTYGTLKKASYPFLAKVFLV